MSASEQRQDDPSRDTGNSTAGRPRGGSAPHAGEDEGTAPRVDHAVTPDSADGSFSEQRVPDRSGPGTDPQAEEVTDPSKD